jgi:hypothetical protein
MQLISAGTALKSVGMPKGTWDTLRQRDQFHLTAELKDLQYVEELDDRSRAQLMDRRGRAGSYLWTVEDVVRLAAVVAFARLGVSIAEACALFREPWFSIPPAAVISLTDGKPTVKICHYPLDLLARSMNETVFTVIDLEKLRRELLEDLRKLEEDTGVDAYAEQEAVVLRVGAQESVIAPEDASELAERLHRAADAVVRAKDHKRELEKA